MTTTIVLPTKNEEGAISHTICEIRAVCDNNILVVDGHSTDDTTFLASQFKNVEIIYDNGKGKGDALRVAFDYCEPDDVVFVDVDGTYELRMIGEFIDALDYGYDTIVGDITYDKGVQSTILGVGLWDMAKHGWELAFGLLYGRIDINNLSGFRGLSRRAINRMHLQEDDFGIETEIEAKTIRLMLTQKVIPIMYYTRIGMSKLENSKWYNVFTKQWREIYWALIKYRFCKLV